MGRAFPSRRYSSLVTARNRTPAEVGLTVVIGLACVAGLAATAGGTGRPRGWAGVAAFLIFGALQVGIMWLSLQPALATR
jgi:hypothetical protein